jgi:peptide/nickel transport system permease protein
MRGWPVFALRRLMVAAGLLLALATVTFFINQAIPYDAGYYLLGNVTNPTREQVQQANERLGVDRPALEQYGTFLSNLAQGDLGISWQTASYDPDEGVVGEPVGPIVLRSAAVTGSLVLGGVLVLLLLAMPLGPFLAARAGSAADRSILIVTLVFVSTHPLVTGLVLQLVFGRKLGWLPDSGYCPLLTSAPEPGFGTGGGSCGGPVDWVTHLVLPWLSFALLFLALYVRQIRTQSLAVLQEPFVTVARAKGATERRVLWHHVIPGVLVVVVTMVAMDVGTALGIALFIEVVYGLPGLGRLLIVSLQGFVGFDRPVIIGIVLVAGATVIVVTLVADLLAAAVDPRVRQAGRRSGRVGSGGV